jgi:hypothetical protein
MFDDLHEGILREFTERQAYGFHSLLDNKQLNGIQVAQVTDKCSQCGAECEGSYCSSVCRSQKGAYWRRWASKHAAQLKRRDDARYQEKRCSKCAKPCAGAYCSDECKAAKAAANKLMSERRRA